MIGGGNPDQDFETDAVQIQKSQVEQEQETGTTGVEPQRGFTNPATEEPNLEKTYQQARYLSEKATGWVSSHGGDVLALLIVSLLLLVQTSIDTADARKDNRDIKSAYGYGVAMSLISLILTLIYYIMARKDALQSFHKVYFAAFMIIWWAIAVGVLTFGDAYKVTANGYFFTWGGFIFAGRILLNELEQAKYFLSKFKALGPQLGALFVGSIVVFFASLECAPKEDCGGENAVPMAVGIISTVLCVLLIFFGGRLSHKPRMVFGVAFLIMWTITVFVATFVGPFKHTGNGYFGCWFAAIASILMLHHIYNSGREQEGELNMV